MRRLVWTAVAVCLTTLWADCLLWFDGDRGPVGWLLSSVVPQAFGAPSALVMLWALWRRAWPVAGLCAAVFVGQVFGPMGLCTGHPSSSPADLKVLSYNIGQFEAGKWPEETVTMVAGTIQRIGPDVACLQEAHYHGRQQFGDRLAKDLPAYHAYHEGGMMILSKRPFEKSETEILASHMGGHWNVQEVTLHVGGRDVRVINVHMVPDSYEPADWPHRPFVERVEHKRQLRDEEIEAVLRHVESRPGPVILCGDFNSQPYDPRIRQLGEVLTDSYRATHFGFGYTSTSKMPTKRIDFVWVRDLRPLRTQVDNSTASDHFPLVAELALR